MGARERAGVLDHSGIDMIDVETKGRRSSHELLELHECARIIRNPFVKFVAVLSSPKTVKHAAGG